jgi:preprotein translocase subunit SecG
MSVITVILYTVVILTALLLIGLILVQQSKGGGFGSAFGGSGDSVFGAHAGTHLTKLTVIMTAVFFILTLALAIITSHKEKSKSAMEVTQDLMSEPAKKAEKKVEKEADSVKTPEADKVSEKKPVAKPVILDKKGKQIPVPVLKKEAEKQEAPSQKQ